MGFDIKIARLIFLLSCCTTFQCCNNAEPSKKEVQFEILEASKTGLDFSNKLTPTDQLNILKYMYYYNGGGVGAGDFNNDGKIDLFFAANQTTNKLFLNTGNLHFKDVTAAAKIPNNGSWSTGVSVVDINNDGLLDIYICKVGNHETLQGSNQLLICKGIDGNGIPFYEDEAKAYGLDFSGYSTQAVFFDYDGDGDLDMYLLNHSIHENGTYGPRKEKLQTFSKLSGDRLFRNDGGKKFTDVTRQAGINSSVIGYGLGITIADIDLDGYPDIYVGNDFHENDYMYINQRDGTFKEVLNEHIMHSSQFSMGVDIADINNDGFPEIISVDMMPFDPYILKRSLIENTQDVFSLKETFGYNRQYSRNNLQLNRKNGMFSEIGLYAGVFASDWTWSPLFFDFDNDGVKDLFLSNGIPKRLNDIDYINFISNKQLKDELKENSAGQANSMLLDKFPKIKIPNKLYRNNPNLQFNDIATEIANDKPGYSNGAVYADLDNDGDLDIVVNNIDEPVFLYENKTNGKLQKPFVEVKLRGDVSNINALGAKIIIFANGGIRTYEKFPVRGFLSSAETPIHIGLNNTSIDSAYLIWPDNTYQPLQLDKHQPFVTVPYKKGLPKFDYNKVRNYSVGLANPMVDITANTNLNYKHEENDFHEFDREPLIPHMVSTEGPALAVGDFNMDGLDDVFIGSSKGKKSAIFFQNASGKFVKALQPNIDNDSTYEDVDACVADINNDGIPDLIVGSGGNEYYGQDTFLTPRVYINDGKGNFHGLKSAFSNVFINASTIAACDFNGDGATDLFIGSRSVPYNYGQTPQSYLLQNDGKGKFTDVTAQIGSEIKDIGFVTNAQWVDIDKDGKKDLVVSLEWGGIIAFFNHNGVFSKNVITDKKGWWNFILPIDVNNDGNISFLAGNLGLNTKLKASEKEPVKLYYNDFDGNGKKEQVLTYFLNSREIPFATKEELEIQMPTLKKKYLYAEEFARASLDDIFSSNKLQQSQILTADYFSNSFILKGKDLSYTVQPLDWMAQLSTYRDAVVVNANNDSLPDILLAGNFYDNNVQMGRYDADFGTVLINKGNGKFTVENIKGLQIKGQVRHIRKITIGKQQAYILVRNNDTAMVIQFDNTLPANK